jgi:23S rRNA maturation mini-RNase III
MQQQMQQLSHKELGYMADSLTNESLMIKECLTLAQQSQDPAIHQLGTELADRHMQHYTHLISVLEQHQQMAPTQPQ